MIRFCHSIKAPPPGMENMGVKRQHSIIHLPATGHETSIGGGRLSLTSDRLQQAHSVNRTRKPA